MCMLCVLSPRSWVSYLPFGRMKPPKRKTRRRARAPPVFAIIIVLQIAAISLNNPAAICWIRNTNNSCLKNLKRKKTTFCYFVASS